MEANYFDKFAFRGDLASNICKTYKDQNGTVTIEWISMYLDEVNHSPTGFSWGYTGSGPSQAAYAMLRVFLTYKFNDVQKAKFFARKMYIIFKFDIVSLLDSVFALSFTEIDKWYEQEKDSIVEEYEKFILQK